MVRKPKCSSDFKNLQLNISRCSTATPCSAARRRRSPAASRSSAPTAWCSRATARSIQRAGRCSSARASARSRSSACRNATSARSTSITRSSCCAWKESCEPVSALGAGARLVQRRCATLSQPPDHAGGPLHAGNRHRHHRAHRRPEAERALERGGGRRQQARRERQHRRRGGGQGPARRLHADGDGEYLHHHACAVQVDCVRSGEGLRAGRARGQRQRRRIHHQRDVAVGHAPDRREVLHRIVRVANGNVALVVNAAALPVRNLEELKAAARERKLSYSSPGNGTPQHLAVELLKQRLGIDILHVPYKGAAQALTDLLGGQVQLAVLPVHTALPHARAGKLTVIAVSGERSSVLAPDSPSFAELGLANLDIDLYFWIAGPAGLPREIVRKWNQEIASIVSAPEVRETLMKQGMVPAPGSPEEISAQIRADVERWKKFIADTGITAD